VIGGTVSNIEWSTEHSDVIFATGKTIWAEEFVNSLFSKFGLDFHTHLREKFPLLEERPARWEVDTTGIKQQCGIIPTRSVLEVALDMLKHNYPSAWEKQFPN
jgi:hypothetical protein